MEFLRGGAVAEAGKIFINYRRGDDPGATGRLFDRSQAAFAPQQLFMDVEGGIGAGADFVDVLRQQVAESDVMLAVIGREWLQAKGEDGRRRLDNPEDFVRIEIVAAMDQSKLVIPVLVGGAAMPTAEQLPDGMKQLSRRNAVRLTHERFQADCAGLIKSLDGELVRMVRDRDAQTAEMARLAVESERQREADAQRARQDEAERQRQRARQDVAANLTPEQLTKAEELANWEFIKEVSDAKEFRDHLARFPAGVTLRMARAKLDAIAWASLGAAPSRAALEGYLAEFPDGAFAGKAQAAKDAELAAAAVARAQAERTAADATSSAERAAREAAAWDAVKNTSDAKTLDAFLRDWPVGAHAVEAQRLRRAMGGGWQRQLLYGSGIAALVLAAVAIFGTPMQDFLESTDSEFVIGRGMAIATVAGDVVHSSSSESLRSCRAVCSANSKCNAFEFLEATRGCFQVSRFSSAYQHGGHNVGVKRGSPYVKLLPK